MRLTAAVVREDDGYVARCLEIEVASEGDTVELALENLREAVELRLDGDADLAVAESPIIAPLDVTRAA